MLRVRSLRCKFTAAVFAGLLIASSTGCVGLTAQVLYFFGVGGSIPAEFSELKHKRVAVVCVSGADVFGSGDDSRRLAKNLETLLNRNLTDLDLVRQDDIADWMDKNNWNHLDYTQIGRGVDAEMVIVVELANLTLHEGQTLLKGRTDATVFVYDISAGGELVYEKDFPGYTFPENGGVPATDNQGKFRRQFFWVLANDIGQLFYPYERIETFGRDARALGAG